MSSPEPVGIIGAGSFGTAMANLMALNTDVYVYSRSPELVAKLKEDRYRFGVKLHERVRVVNDFPMVADRCQLLFPIVPSNNFRGMMRSITEHLRPAHVLIHGTKGFDITGVALEDIPETGPFPPSDAHHDGRDQARERGGQGRRAHRARTSPGSCSTASRPPP